MKPLTWIYLALGWLAIFFIPWLWYDTGEIIIGGDLTFPLKPLDYFQSIFELWRRVYTGSHSAISLTTLPFYAPMALADSLGFSLQQIQKIHFGLWLALPAISMFYLAGLIFKDRPRRLVAQIIAVSVYLFNTYQVVWADSARMAVWVGLPLMLGFFIQGLEDRQGWWRWSAAIGLISIVTATAAANPPMFLMMAAVFVYWLIFFLATNPMARQTENLARIGKFISLTAVLVIIVNLFWIVPYAKVLLADYGDALSSGLSGIQFQDWLDPVSTNTSLLRVLQLQGAWDWYAGWQGEPYVPAAQAYQENIFYLKWSVLIPLLAFASLLTGRSAIKYRYLYFFSGLALLGIFFAAGSHEPTGPVYKWLVEKIPFLSIYRSPWYKFSAWTVLGYSILIAHTIVMLIDWLERRSSLKTVAKTYLSLGLVASFLVANTIYASGLVLGKVFPRQNERQRLHSAHVTFPDYFFQAADWINQQSGDFRILQLPAQQAFNYRWGLGTLMDMTIFAFNQPTLWWPEQTGSGPAKPGSEQTVKTAFQHYYYETPDITRLLGWLNVRYLLQKNDIDYGFYGGAETAELLQQKAKAQGLSLTYQQGPWQFYELNKKFQQPLFTAKSGYVAIDSKPETLVASIIGPNYEYQASYGSVLEKPPTDLVSGTIIVPDWTQGHYADGRFIVPFRATQAGEYRLALNTSESFALAIDDQPLVLTTDGLTQSVRVQLSVGNHNLIITLDSPTNLVQDPSFENNIWPTAGEAKTLTHPNSFYTRLVPNATDGRQAAEISSQFKPLVLTRGIDYFENDHYYWLSFDYRHLEGQPAKMDIWQPGSNVREPSIELATHSEWRSSQIVWRPRPLATGAYLSFYADPGQSNPIKTTVAYDNIKVIKLPSFLTNLSLQTVLPAIPPAPQISYSRLSPTRYKIDVSQAKQPFILNFLEQFDSGWQIANLSKIEAPNHFQSYGYANSWLITKTGSYQFLLEFRPQRLFYTATAASIAGMFLSLWLLWGRKRRKPAA